MSNSLLFRRAFYSTLRCERRRSASCHGRITSSATTTSRTPNSWSSLRNCTNVRLYSTQNGRYWKTVDDKTQQTPANSFIVMSYNILAQHHVNSQPSLYHAHQSDALRWTHRFDALKREIDEISPDILCLQEVQQSHLTEIANHFNTMGYDTSLFKKRTGLQVDGCAIFFKKTLFELIEFHFVDYFQPDIKILNRCNVAIIAKFAHKSNPSTNFVVSTTHLLFNPKRHDIRLAQMQVLLAELDRVARDNAKQQQIAPIILTGDFNIQQNSEVFRLIIGESVAPRDVFEKLNFKFGKTHANLLPYKMGISDECQHFDVVVNGNRYQTALHSGIQYGSENSSIATRTLTNEEINNSKLKDSFNTGAIQHKLNLLPTICTAIPFRADTKHASTYHNKWIMVDYIFYSEANSMVPSLRLLENYQLPTIVECLSTGPIPNEHLGSDHYAIAARFSIE